MSSPLSDALEKAIDKKIEKLEERQKNRVEIAMEKTEERVKEKIGEIIKSEGLDPYYEGYSPSMYVRTNQLKNSRAVSAKTEPFNKNGLVGFRYGARFDESKMDHTVYMLNMVYKHKKDSGIWQRQYEYHDEDVDEKEILDNFRFGIHPNTGVEQGIFWQMESEGERSGRIPDAIIAWKKNGAIKEIFLDELRKLKKK